MQTLKRYNLQFDLTLKYFVEHLTNVNTLSNMLLNINNFKSGVFFTLLTENSKVERIYEFESGGILPQNDPVKYLGTTETFTPIPSIKETLSQILSQEIHLNPNLTCILDDVSRKASYPGLEIFSQTNSILEFNDELYYILIEENNSPELMFQLILQSFTFWHSLGIITETLALIQPNRILSREILESICKELKLVFIGAYDGEGYIFWEKTPATLRLAVGSP